VGVQYSSAPKSQSFAALGKVSPRPVPKLDRPTIPQTRAFDLGGRFVRPPANENGEGRMACRQRRGGLLRYYHREAAGLPRSYFRTPRSYFRTLRDLRCCRDNSFSEADHKKSRHCLCTWLIPVPAHQTTKYFTAGYLTPPLVATQGPYSQPSLGLKLRSLLKPK
jgi:hypothetical protein